MDLSILSPSSSSSASSDNKQPVTAILPIQRVSNDVFFNVSRTDVERKRAVYLVGEL